ncbi:uncharacterized protein LOC132986985 [Labrus mixtus]|uniref:uncharacterized protein LOC132986985 n=1 Tax=Labrus mixtus TaxID=508554 RepID=UPI0029C0197A|nr:uncharacterized protein LOC132986985 [Labrus mixtus]
MEERGFSHLPPVEPLLAAYLHPSQKSTMTSASPSLPSKADCFQSSLTEKGYKAVAMSVRALNASSLLLAYQAELEDNNGNLTLALWDELCVVTDLCLRLHRCAVQTSGSAMALMVSQERARWLNLSSLSHKEKTQLLDVPVDPKGLFGPAVAIMQKRCEESKREGEALQLCLPRKVPPSQIPAARQTFAQAVARPAYRIPKRQPQPQTSGRSQSIPPELKGAWAKKPFAASVTLRDQVSGPVTLGAKKKRRATLRGVGQVGQRAQPDARPVPLRKCSVPKNVWSGMFQALQEVRRSHDGSHSLQLYEEEEGRTCREHRAQQWRVCGVSDWVLKTVTKGYRLQFACTPPRFNGILQSSAHGEKAQVLQEEIASLLNKGAIQKVPLEQCQNGFYSRYFLVPKKGGGLRPILDLRTLNEYMRKYKFRILMYTALLRFVHHGDWFASIDLKDAYFHIHLYPPHRKGAMLKFKLCLRLLGLMASALTVISLGRLHETISAVGCVAKIEPHAPLPSPSVDLLGAAPLETHAFSDYRPRRCRCFI